MKDFLTALSLAMVIEGVTYALFPGGMQRLMSTVIRLPPPMLRAFGLLIAVSGLVGVWLARATFFAP
ncbi:MAG TPA: DUF2065 domain-containing protein [Candidatus Omnitrophota bacterium]|nr:DUF2065 domain-containing protein [Candidatus Omnitrophota bacterium]